MAAVVVLPRPEGSGPVASEGVLDLRSWNPEKDGPVELVGSWRFYWRQLLPASPDCALGDGALAELPGFWTGSELAGETLPAEGFATYCLRLLLPDEPPTLAILLPRMRTSRALWANGEALGDVSAVGTDRASSEPRRTDVVVATKPEPELNLTLQVSNFHFRSGGPYQPLLLGTPETLDPLSPGRPATLGAFFVGAFVALGLYHLLVQPIRAGRLAPAVFGALCLTMAAYQVARENYLFTSLLPGVSWRYEVRLEYTLFGLCVVLGATFFRVTFPTEVSSALPRTALLLGASFIAAVWWLPLTVSSDKVLLAYQISFLGLGAWGVHGIARAARRGRTGAHWFFVGAALAILTGTGDAFMLRFAPSMPKLLPFGFMALIVAQSVLLAIAQLQTERRTQRLSNRFLRLASEKLALETMAYQDPLTGLENRRRLDEDTERIRQRDDARFAGAKAVSLLYLDVDDFKGINDRHGHEVGDEVLIRVAELLREEFRSYDLSARLGGDEFAVLLGAEEEEARAQARRLQRRLEEPLEVGDLQLPLAVSIGVATVEADQVDLDDLLRRADRDMYRDKRERKAGRS